MPDFKNATTAALLVALAAMPAATVLSPATTAVVAAEQPAGPKRTPPARWAADPDDEWMGLPEGPGREQVFYTCPACHSLMLVRQQGLSREIWDETLDWMVREQKMEPMDPKDRALALDYLARWYGPDRKALNLKK